MTKLGAIWVPTLTQDPRGARRFILETRTRYANSRRKAIPGLINHRRRDKYARDLALLLERAEIIDANLPKLYYLFPEKHLEPLVEIIEAARFQSSILASAASVGEPLYVLDHQTVQEYTAHLMNAQILGSSLISWTQTEEGSYHRRAMNQSLAKAQCSVERWLDTNCRPILMEDCEHDLRDEVPTILDRAVASRQMDDYPSPLSPSDDEGSPLTDPSPFPLFHNPFTEGSSTSMDVVPECPPSLSPMTVPHLLPPSFLSNETPELCDLPLISLPPSPPLSSHDSPKTPGKKVVDGDLRTRSRPPTPSAPRKRSSLHLDSDAESDLEATSRSYSLSPRPPVSPRRERHRKRAKYIRRPLLEPFAFSGQTADPSPFDDPWLSDNMSVASSIEVGPDFSHVDGWLRDVSDVDDHSEVTSISTSFDGSNEAMSHEDHDIPEASVESSESSPVASNEVQWEDVPRSSFWIRVIKDLFPIFW